MVRAQLSVNEKAGGRMRVAYGKVLLEHNDAVKNSTRSFDNASARPFDCASGAQK